MRGDTEGRCLLGIVIAGALLRLVAAAYLGDVVEPKPGGAYDQVFFHDVALNLLAGKGFVFTRPPWPFIQPGAATAYTSFLYQLFLAGIYLVVGPYPLAARIIQALICSLMPWQVYGLVRRLLSQPPTWGERAGAVALVAAGITAGYAYFIYYSATLLTEGLYLMAVVWALRLTLELGDRPTARRWAAWGLAVSLATLFRQVFMSMAGLLFLYVMWKARDRVRLLEVAVACGVAAALILPWTVRNYLVFHRFLLLNSQFGQVLWNANHPDHGVHFSNAMFPVPADLKGANEVDLTNELMRRALRLIAEDPWRFVRLSLSRAVIFFTFWPSARSPLVSSIFRTLSFGICLPLMIGGLWLSRWEWRRWLLLYLFMGAYTLIHVLSWTQIRYRMPIDVALVPFAALAVVALAGRLQHERARSQPIGVDERV